MQQAQSAELNAETAQKLIAESHDIIDSSSKQTEMVTLSIHESQQIINQLREFPIILVRLRMSLIIYQIKLTYLP